MILYGSEMWNSPYVLSCFVALREKRLPFETRLVALHRGAQHEPAYVGASLTARVPAFADGALSISESSAIVEYLEDKFPAPGHPRALPADVADRARAAGHVVGAERPGGAAGGAVERVRVLSGERSASAGAADGGRAARGGEGGPRRFAGDSGRRGAAVRRGVVRRGHGPRDDAVAAVEDRVRAAREA